MNKAIVVENLYKEYQLGIIGRGTLYRDLQSWWAKILNKEDPNTIIGHSTKDRRLQKKSKNLALDKLSFEIQQGELVGIIGANGAGKSTLLKILSRVTGPTKGIVKIKGKTSSLLEVGTGFHPELTGRENIYLNGAINGMSKNETSRKLDEIVDFAGVEQYLDTPIKRYSSGMHVRLGFAVAAHLEPDILIVDEVLAVGDAAFQKKAVKKMNEVSKYQGRVVLIVSHNMELIKNLCKRAIVLSKGKIAYDGEVEGGVNRYIGKISYAEKRWGKNAWHSIKDAPGGDIVKLKSIVTKNENNEIVKAFNITEKVIIEIEFWVLKDNYQVCNSIGFMYASKQTLKGEGNFYLLDNYVKNNWGKQKSFNKGLYLSRLEIPKNLLNEGIFSLIVDIFLPPADPDSSFQVREHNALSFEIIDDFSMEGARGSFPNDWQRGSTGYVIRPKVKFETKKIENI